MMMTRRRGWERIALPAEVVAPSFGVLGVPTLNPSMGLVLEVNGLGGHGYLLELRDPAGHRVWYFQLVAEGAEPLPQPEDC